MQTNRFVDMDNLSYQPNEDGVEEYNNELRESLASYDSNNPYSAALTDRSTSINTRENDPHFLRDFLSHETPSPAGSTDSSSSHHRPRYPANMNVNDGRK